MSKSMMGSAGGGKVTVEGLDAEVLLAGNIVKVLQGAKEILSVEGTLEVLAVFGSGGGSGIAYGGAIFWNGETYTVQMSRSITFVGTPKLVYAGRTSGYGTFTVGGNSISTGFTIVDVGAMKNNTITFNPAGQPYTDCGTSVVVLGIK